MAFFLVGFLVVTMTGFASLAEAQPASAIRDTPGGRAEEEHRALQTQLESLRAHALANAALGSLEHAQRALRVARANNSQTSSRARAIARAALILAERQIRLAEEYELLREAERRHARASERAEAAREALHRARQLSARDPDSATERSEPEGASPETSE